MGQELSKVDKIIDSYNANKESLIQICLDIHSEYNWLSGAILKRISEKLGIPLSKIYQLTTFYKHFSLVPKGRHTISVCLGTACHVRGAMRLLDRVTQAVGVGPGETTSDEKFSLSTVNCLGCCALGPVMVLDGEYIGDPTPKQIKGMVESCE